MHKTLWDGAGGSGSCLSLLEGALSCVCSPSSARDTGSTRTLQTCKTNVTELLCVRAES